MNKSPNIKYLDAVAFKKLVTIIILNFPETAVFH